MVDDLKMKFMRHDLNRPNPTKLFKLAPAASLTQTRTVNKQCYVVLVLNKFWMDDFKTQLRINRNINVFPQNGATLHTANKTF